MKSFAARSSVSGGPGSASHSPKGGAKKKSIRKSSKQYSSISNGGHLSSNGSHSGVSPLAFPNDVSVSSHKIDYIPNETEKTQTQSIPSLPPIADQTEEDIKEDSSLLDSSKLEIIRDRERD